MEDLLQQIEGFKSYFVPSLYIFGVSIIILETLLYLLNKKPRDKAGRIASIVCGVLSFGNGYLVSITLLFAAQSWVYEHRIFNLGFEWYVWVLCFIINDFVFYINHWAHHMVRLFWCTHVVHHSAKHYDLTTGIRGSFFDAVFTFPFIVWIPILGIHPVIFILLDTAFKFIGLSYHSAFINKLGFLDKILVTPSNHRVHHGADVKYLDRNYSGFFIFWDQLFGTFQKEEERPEFGIRKNTESNNIFHIQLHEFASLWKDVKSAPTFSDKLKYIFYPPGWRHDGKLQTTKQLRLEAGPDVTPTSQALS